jgi:hypothetical protein
VTDFGVQVDMLYLIKVSCTCLRETKNGLINKDTVCVKKIFYSCTAGTMHISLCLVCS